MQDALGERAFFSYISGAYSNLLLFLKCIDESLIKKIRIRPDQKNLILNPPAGYQERLGKIPADHAEKEGMAGQYDLVHLFVYNQNDLSRLAPEAIRALKHDGLLWISYPKISSKIKSDLNRDKGWEPVTEAGLEGIAQIAIDEVWSAIRFRPKELVRKTR